MLLFCLKTMLLLFQVIVQYNFFPFFKVKYSQKALSVATKVEQEVKQKANSSEDRREKSEILFLYVLLLQCAGLRLLPLIRPVLQVRLPTQAIL